MTKNPTGRSWGAPLATVGLAVLAAWLVTTATIPAARARMAAERKCERLMTQKQQIEQETERLRAEAKALSGDYQYNRRVQRWLFRGGPEPGD